MVVCGFNLLNFPKTAHGIKHMLNRMNIQYVMVNSIHLIFNTSWCAWKNSKEIEFH